MEPKTWAERLAAKIGEQIDRAESGHPTDSADDSDNDQEVTGALIEFLDVIDEVTGDPARSRLQTLRALYRLVAP